MLAAATIRALLIPIHLGGIDVVVIVELARVVLVGGIGGLVGGIVVVIVGGMVGVVVVQISCVMQ